jgi:hypothetical protein
MPYATPSNDGDLHTFTLPTNSHSAKTARS